MSVNVCCHIYNFGFIYENINIFLSNDHFWNYQNLNSRISQTQLDIYSPALKKYWIYPVLPSFCDSVIP